MKRLGSGRSYLRTAERREWWYIWKLFEGREREELNMLAVVC
jgi:hypothetical protein